MSRDEKGRDVRKQILSPGTDWLPLAVVATAGACGLFMAGLVIYGLSLGSV